MIRFLLILAVLLVIFGAGTVFKILSTFLLLLIGLPFLVIIFVLFLVVGLS